MGLTRIISGYRIAHRLPGRIRIQIPMLARLPDEWWPYIEPSVELIKMKSEITSAEIQPVTGSLLISYDPDRIDEARVLNWLEKLVSDFIKLGISSEPMDEANVRHRFRQLRNRLSQESVPCNRM